MARQNFAISDIDKAGGIALLNEIEKDIQLIIDLNLRIAAQIQS